ncbi:MAG: MFS transporter [Cytophagales bacterium]
MMISRKKIQNAWCMYDWANSVYSLTIVTAIFPSYYNGVMKSIADSEGFLELYFFKIEYLALYSYLLSSAFLFVVILNLILSGVAQELNKNKFFMKFFCYLGSLGCIMLFFFDSEHILFGLIGFFLATVGFAGSLPYYNAFLPMIAKAEEQDKVSAKGYSLGYVGSVLLLIVSLIFVTNANQLGITEGFACRLSFLMVGVWWFGFSQITFSYLPRDRKSKQNFSFKMLNAGFKELSLTFKKLSGNKMAKRFLMAFLFYSIGFQVIMYLSPLFATEELGIETSGLIVVILTIQMVAILGAFLIAMLSKRIGNMKALLICVLASMGICVGAYFTRNEFDFNLLAFGVGLLMGGMQSLSRSSFSKMLTEGKTQSEMFSVYEFVEKTAIVSGSVIYGLCYQLTGSMRNSILFLLLFFFIAVSIFWLGGLTSKKIKPA